MAAWRRAGRVGAGCDAGGGAAGHGPVDRACAETRAVLRPWRGPGSLPGRLAARLGLLFLQSSPRGAPLSSLAPLCLCDRGVCVCGTSHPLQSDTTWNLLPLVFNLDFLMAQDGQVSELMRRTPRGASRTWCCRLSAAPPQLVRTSWRYGLSRPPYACYCAVVWCRTAHWLLCVPCHAMPCHAWRLAVLVALAGRVAGRVAGQRVVLAYIRTGFPCRTPLAPRKVFPSDSLVVVISVFCSETGTYLSGRKREGDFSDLHSGGSVLSAIKCGKEGGGRNSHPPLHCKKHLHKNSKTLTSGFCIS